MAGAFIVVDVFALVQEIGAGDVQFVETAGSGRFGLDGYFEGAVVVVVGRTSLEFYLLFPAGVGRPFLGNGLDFKPHVIVLVAGTPLERP